MIRFVLAALLACFAVPAWAALAPKALQDVALELPPHASVPLDLHFSDTQGRATTLSQALGGRATLLVPVDYVCPATCGPAASIISAALTQTGLRPGQDFSLVFVGLRPDESAADRVTFLEQHIGEEPLRKTARALTGDEGAIASLMQAIGYRYTKDESTNSFAHPTGAVALAADGRVTRVLSTVALDANDLKLALVEASQGKVGGIGARLRLLCYGFDAARGIYTSRITTLLRIAGASTVVAVAAALLLMGARSAVARSRT